MEADVEFLDHTRKVGKKVLCAHIQMFEDYVDDVNGDGYIVYEVDEYLHIGYTEQEFKDFLNGIHHDYDSGYGSQNLFGTIWFEDMTYSDRGEYDGSEWWEHHQPPEIPFQCFKKVDKEK